MTGTGDAQGPSMTEPYRITSPELSMASATLAEAFMDDPLWIRIFRDFECTPDRMGAAFSIPLRHCFRYGEVHAVSPDMEGIACWVRGRHADMTFWRILRSGGLACAMKMGMGVARAIRPLGETLTARRNENMKGKPYWYLVGLGVAKAHQGQGHGSRLLSSMMARCDRESLSIYLETETTENVGFYEKRGFEVLWEVVIPVLEVPMWEMIRHPGG